MSSVITITEKNQNKHRNLNKTSVSLFIGFLPVKVSKFSMVTVNRTSLVKIGMSFYPSGRYSLNQGRKNSSWGRKGNVIPKWLELIRDCLECEHPTKVGTNCSSCGDFFEDFSKTRKACQCKTSQVCCILCGLETCENCAEDPLDVNRRCGRYDCPPQ